MLWKEWQSLMSHNYTLKHGKTLFKVEAFESAFELTRTNRSRPFLRGEDSIRSIHGGASWAGCSSYDEAEQLLVGGWADHLNMVNKSLGKDFCKEEPKRITFENNVEGYVPIVPLALLGLPNSMVDVRRKRMKYRIIDIYYDLGVHADVNPERMLKTGKKVLGIIVALEKQGYRVRLSSMDCFTDHEATDGDCLVLRIKNENQPIDLKRVMFPMFHPAMLRAIGFAWYERVPFGKEKSGYGQTFNHHFKEEERRDIITELFGPQAVYLAGHEIEKIEGKELEKYIKEKIIAVHTKLPMEVLEIRR